MKTVTKTIKYTGNQTDQSFVISELKTIYGVTNMTPTVGAQPQQGLGFNKPLFRFSGNTVIFSMASYAGGSFDVTFLGEE